MQLAGLGRRSLILADVHGSDAKRTSLNLRGQLGAEAAVRSGAFHQAVHQRALILAAHGLFQQVALGVLSAAAQQHIRLGVEEGVERAGFHVDDAAAGLAADGVGLENLFIIFGVAAVEAGTQNHADVAAVVAGGMLGQRAQQGGHGIVEDDHLMIVLRAQLLQRLLQALAHQRALDAGHVHFLIQVEDLAVQAGQDAAREGEAEADAVALVGHGQHSLGQLLKELVGRDGAGLAGHGLLVVLENFGFFTGLDAQEGHAQVGAARVHHNHVAAVLGQRIHGEVGRQHGQAALLALHALFHMVNKRFLHGLHFVPGLDKADLFEKFRYALHKGKHSFRKCCECNHDTSFRRILQALIFAGLLWTFANGICYTCKLNDILC